MDTVNQVINDIVKYRHAFFVDDMIALLVHCFRYGQINVIENSFAWKHVWPLRHHVSDSDSIEIRQKYLEMNEYISQQIMTLVHNHIFHDIREKILIRLQRQIRMHERIRARRLCPIVHITPDLVDTLHNEYNELSSMGLDYICIMYASDVWNEVGDILYELYSTLIDEALNSCHYIAGLLNFRDRHKSI